jgi:hypothetical protein
MSSDAIQSVVCTLQCIGIQEKVVTQVALHPYDHQQEILLNETNLILRAPLQGSDTASAEVQSRNSHTRRIASIGGTVFVVMSVIQLMRHFFLTDF